MAQFCRNCGTQLPENTSFCPNCGTQASQNTPQQSVNPQYQNYPQQTRPKKTPVALFAGIGALVVVVIVLAIVFLGGGGGYKGVVQKYFSSIQSGDVKKAASCYPPDAQEDFIDYMGDDLKEYSKAIKSLKYEIIDTDKMDKSDIDDLEDDYDYYYDKKVKIAEAYELEVEIFMKMDYSKLDDHYGYYEYADDEFEETIYITVLKIKGKWYLIDESM